MSGQNGQTTGYIFFEFPHEARDYREKNGGWIFLPDLGGALWFAARYTPSSIITHPAARGGGRLA